MYKSKVMEGIHKCAFKAVLPYSLYMCAYFFASTVGIEPARTYMNQDNFDNMTWHCLGQEFSQEERVFAC